MVHRTKVTQDEVHKISKLANLGLLDNEPDLFADQFTQTINIIDQLNEVDTTAVSSTYQVTGLSNITREDEIDLERVLPQNIATRESKNTYNGYFVVTRIIDTDLY